MNLEESDFYSAILQTKGLLAQVDISDVKRAYPDGSHFDFPRLIEALNQIDYQDYLVFEYNSIGNGIAEATSGLHYIRSLYR
jgi:sugar phosphate isomerase/epimerase